MKTKDLIRRLQEADPTGELHVSVGNIDILTVYRVEHYYDGRQERLMRDETSPYYNVVGGYWSTEGHKVVIRDLSIEDAIFEDPDLPVYNVPEHQRRIIEDRRHFTRLCELPDSLTHPELEHDEMMELLQDRYASGYYPHNGPGTV